MRALAWEIILHNFTMGFRSFKLNPDFILTITGAYVAFLLIVFSTFIIPSTHTFESQVQIA